MAGLLQQKLAKGGIEPIKGLIRQFRDPPQRMTGRNPQTLRAGRSDIQLRKTNQGKSFSAQ
jgi:hypothetical protein